MKLAIGFDNDGFIRNEKPSYGRCSNETVAFYDNGRLPSQKEIDHSIEITNNDWVRTHNILKDRGIIIPFEDVKEHFQDLYLGKKRDFTGYIVDEPYLADNTLLGLLSEKYPLFKMKKSRMVAFLVFNLFSIIEIYYSYAILILSGLVIHPKLE